MDVNQILGRLERAQVQPLDRYANEMVGDSPEVTRAAVDQISAILKVRARLLHARQTHEGYGMMTVGLAGRHCQGWSLLDPSVFADVLWHHISYVACPPQVRRRLLHPHNALLGATYDALATVLAHLQPPRWAAAVAACGRSVEILEAAYPLHSLVVAHQMQTHASMLQAAGDEDAADEIYHKTAHVFQLHYGTVTPDAG